VQSAPVNAGHFSDGAWANAIDARGIPSASNALPGLLSGQVRGDDPPLGIGKVTGIAAVPGCAAARLGAMQAAAGVVVRGGSATLGRLACAEGRTVLVSSHLMSEMQNTADRLIIIGQGRLIAQAAIGELLAAGSGSYVRVRSPQASELAAALEASGAVVSRQDNGTLVVTDASTDTIGELARASGFTLTELSVQQASLEDRYMELTRDSADYRTPGTVFAARK